MSTVINIAETLPSDPRLIKIISDGLNEISNSKARAKAETQLQTDIFNKMAEETGVSNQFLRSIATADAEGGVDKMIAKVEAIEVMYDRIQQIRKPKDQE